MANKTKQNIVSKRYSEALIELVNDGKVSFETISKNLDSIQEILKNSPDLKEFLINPLVSINNKKEIITKVFKDEVNTYIIYFLNVLIDKNRFDIINDIIDSYKERLDAINELARVNVVSAIELTEDNKNKLTKKLEEKMKKQVYIDWEINPNIIAGLIIKIGDNIIDTSLRHKLEEMSKKIIK